MAGHEAEKMRSVNIQLTDEVIVWIDGVGSESRSETTRMVVAAILASLNAGKPDAWEAAINAARRTTPEIRNAVSDAHIAIWRKAIVWIPESMEAEIVQLLRDITGGLRVSDMIRGALFGAAGEDPFGKLSPSGHEFWAGQVEDASRAGE